MLGAPFSRIKSLMAIAVAAMSILPVSEQGAERARILGGYRSRGHGGRHTPRKAGARKVAWDKRDARKRRNRMRAKGAR